MKEKSEPFGVRFNLEQLEFNLKHSGKKTKQGLVDMLMEVYYKQFKVMPDTPVFNQQPPKNNITHYREKEQPKGFDYYLRQIRDLEGQEECLDFVAKVDADEDLLWNQKKTLKERLQSKFI